MHRFYKFFSFFVFIIIIIITVIIIVIVRMVGEVLLWIVLDLALQERLSEGESN